MQHTLDHSISSLDVRRACSRVIIRLSGMYDLTLVLVLIKFAIELQTD